MPTRVVYLHGMGGTPEDWRAVQARQPGLALTLEVSAGAPEECALALAGEVSKQMSGSFALSGYSMGGRMAILAARALLERKRKPDALILVATGLGGGSEEERASRNHTDEAWAALAGTKPEEFWQKWYEQDLFASFRALPEATRKTWLEQRAAIDPGELASQLSNLGPARHGDLFPVLKDLAAKGVRVLYLAGELDPKYAELAQKVGTIPGVKAEVLQGAGHVLPLEAPDALAQRIAKFIK